jgi:phosphatidylglycerophosphate synthase
VILPFLILSFRNDLILIADGLFLFAIATDFADGYAAKRLRVSSKLGALLDAAIDFVFIFCMFINFAAQGLYPTWLLSVIAVAFAQFVLTGFLSETVYDPVGKYYGSLLYGAIGLTLLSSGRFVIEVVEAGVTLATIASILSRLLYLVKKAIAKRNAAPIQRPASESAVLA